ncbi:uncharacterized protein C8orf74 homolog [Rhinatrema bivittatum]|uniref:uncharacterized protein C8orf74 homolog n=1 Tax=Rhinatrema bivittatum TaxID=194408 RepID=UPI00112BD714|nr:uncharacterized protein C8orf74 homolog [Rhinatrema bivittatum]
MASWLSAAVVQKVVQLQKAVGRKFLRESLKWDDFDDVGDLRESVLLDVLYDSLSFAADKGFPWSAVALSGKLSEELMNECKGLSVSEALSLLKDKLKAYESQLTRHQLLILFDYFINTFIKHYQLYQFVLCQSQDLHRTAISLEIYAPPHPLPLNEGCDVNVYLYQQQVANLSAAEIQKRTDLLLFKEKLYLHNEKMLENIYKHLRMQDSQILNRKLLEKLVKEVIGSQIKVVDVILKEEIKTCFEILELKLQKKILVPPSPFPAAAHLATPKGELSKTLKNASKPKMGKK